MAKMAEQARERSAGVAMILYDQNSQRLVWSLSRFGFYRIGQAGGKRIQDYPKCRSMAPSPAFN